MCTLWGTIGRHTLLATRLIDTSDGAERDLADAYSLALSPVGPEVAWANAGTLWVTRPFDRTSRRLRLPGYRFGRIGWSPDGKLIAYPGHLNPWIDNGWTTDLRVIDPATGRSALLAKGLWCPSTLGPLRWVASETTVRH